MERSSSVRQLQANLTIFLVPVPKASQWTGVALNGMKLIQRTRSTVTGYFVHVARNSSLELIRT